MFENLTNKFEEIFSSLKKAPSLDENQVDEGLKSIRLALLEADVSIEVVKEFINRVKPKALGQEIVRSTSPGQMVVKIVYDELVSFLGNKTSEIKLNAVPPVPIMLVGLQGSGKTTTTAKLARYLEKNNKKKIMMVSLDVYRPAAQEQLRLLGEQNNKDRLKLVKNYWERGGEKSLHEKVRGFYFERCLEISLRTILRSFDSLTVMTP